MTNHFAFALHVESMEQTVELFLHLHKQRGSEGGEALAPQGWRALSNLCLTVWLAVSVVNSRILKDHRSCLSVKLPFVLRTPALLLTVLSAKGVCITGWVGIKGLVRRGRPRVFAVSFASSWEWKQLLWLC